MGALASPVALAPAALAATVVEGPAVFEGPPHLLWREGGATAVLLARGRIRGALARISKAGQGEVVVPGATFDRHSFPATVMAQAGLPGLKLSETADGAVRIEVSGYALTELEPRVATAPARLLLRIGGSPREAVPTAGALASGFDAGQEVARAPGPARGETTSAAQPLELGTIAAQEVAVATAPVRGETTSAAQPLELGPPPAQDATRTTASIVSETLLPRATSVSDDAALGAREAVVSETLLPTATLAPSSPPAQGDLVAAVLPSDERGPTPEDAALPDGAPEEDSRVAMAGAGEVVPLASTEIASSADAQVAAPALAPVAERAVPGPVASPRLECRWRRLAGVALCAPDPSLSVYRATPELAAVAGALSEARAAPPPRIEAGQIGAAAHYLAADRELVAAGTSGYPHAAVALYERALRLHPDFADAPRGVANLLLLYRSLGFRPELEREARRSGSVGQGLAQALLGELTLEDGHIDEALDGFGDAAVAGGIGACIALRGRSRAELARGRSAEARTVAAGLSEICSSTVLEDPASEALGVLLDANLSGERGVAARLVAIAGRLAGREQDEILRHAVRLAASDEKAAGEIWQEIGRRGGASAAGRAAIEALARRDALGGTPERAFARLLTLPPTAADAARRRVELSLAGAAIDRGAYAKAFGQLFESGAAIDELSDPQARALRDHLDRLGVRTGGTRPGAAAPPGSDTTGFAVAARTAALAGFGPEVLSNTRALISLDPGAGAALALELGEALAVADPGVALDLVGLGDRADPRARWLEARVAQRAGENARALVAYEELARSRTQHPFSGEAAWRGACLAETAGRVQLALELYRHAERTGDEITRRLAVLGRRRLERGPGMAAGAAGGGRVG